MKMLPHTHQVILDNLIDIEFQINEVRAWLKSTCIGEWDLLYGPQFYCNSYGEQIAFNKSIIIATFETPDDAVMFKLRWK